MPEQACIERSGTSIAALPFVSRLFFVDRHRSDITGRLTSVGNVVGECQRRSLTTPSTSP